MSATPLRVGVLIDSPSLPRWAHRVLVELATAESWQLALVVRNAAPGGGRRGRWPSLFSAYEALDARFFRAPNDYSEPVDASPWLARSENVTVTPQRRGAFEELSASDVETLRAHDLDVLLQLGFGPLAGDVLDVARHGLWVFGHDDLERHGIPPLCWEMLRGDGATETRLEAHTTKGRRLLYRSWGATERNSLYRNRNGAFWKSSEFVPRALRALAENRPAQAPIAEPPAPAPARAPHALHVARFAAGMLARILRSRLRARRLDCEWFLAQRHGEPAAFCEGPLTGFDAIPNPPGRYRADPFLLRSGEQTWLFFEEAESATDKGLLKCMSIDAGGACGEPEVILEREHHLSYPFVFEWQGAHFMIPEAAETRTIALYRALELPTRWTLEKVLFQDVYAVDTTLLEADGRLWLFTAMSLAGGSANDELFLFHSDSLHGAWIPHPQNPVVSDVRRARPAGRIFREGGAWIRPGQDCSTAYGAATVLSRIDVLNEREYRETPIARIDPDWAPGLAATHTVAAEGELAVIDGRRWTPRSR